MNNGEKLSISNSSPNKWTANVIGWVYVGKHVVYSKGDWAHETYDLQRI